MQTETYQRETVKVLTPAVSVCESCGLTTAPDGTCLEVGDCRRADEGATRGASGGTAKFRVPAAWNARGSVD